MQNIRSNGTKPEQIIMHELKIRKIYFASHVTKIIGKPDIVFRRRKILVFIDSDFWHKHPKNFKQPQTNTEYWLKKINYNKNRDIEVTQTLEKDGWRVLRLWESDIKKNKDECIEKILRLYIQD